MYPFSRLPFSAVGRHEVCLQHTLLGKSDSSDGCIALGPHVKLGMAAVEAVMRFKAVLTCGAVCSAVVTNCAVLC